MESNGLASAQHKPVETTSQGIRSLRLEMCLELDCCGQSDPAHHFICHVSLNKSGLKWSQVAKADILRVMAVERPRIAEGGGGSCSSSLESLQLESLESVSARVVTAVVTTRRCC